MGNTGRGNGRLYILESYVHDDGGRKGRRRAGLPEGEITWPEVSCEHAPRRTRLCHHGQTRETNTACAKSDEGERAVDQSYGYLEGEPSDEAVPGGDA